MDAPQKREVTRTHELLARFVEGDRTAAEQLFAGHREFLLRRASRHRLMRALESAQTPEDLVDECLLRVLQGRVLARFEDRGPGTLRSLLSAILDRGMKDAYRRLRAAKRGGKIGRVVPLPPLEGGSGARPTPRCPASNETTPTGAARASELLELCRRVLSPPEWDVWNLTEIEGLDSSEVAKRVGSTAGAVRSKMRRIRGRLVREIAAFPSP